MKIAKIAVCALLFTLLSGCCDNAEIEDRSYVVMLSLDKFSEATEHMADENCRYTVGFGAARLSESALEAEGEPFIISSADIESAVAAAAKYNDKPPYLGQLKTIVIGKELAEDFPLLAETVERLEADPDVGMKTLVITADGRAEEALKAAFDEKGAGPLYVWSYFKNTANVKTPPDLESLISQLRENREISLPKISIEGNSLKINGEKNDGND